MTPSQRAWYSCDKAHSPKWRLTVPPIPLKHLAAAPKPWPVNPHPGGHVHRSQIPSPLPHVPLFHTRHAEESAERPHLVTIVRPCGKNILRKVTVLLNRRGVVSFEQLLLDISEALGVPRWHSARVTRLYTTHAREVKGVCDFFRGDVAFLALGKCRPELSSIKESLEELFPDHLNYRAEALLAWERRLRTPPGKAPKADSGYSEGADSNGVNPNTQQDSKKDVKNQRNTMSSLHADKHKTGNNDFQKVVKRDSSRKLAHLPNHLQRLRIRGSRIREREPSGIGPFKNDEIFKEADIPSPMLCEKCLSRKAKHHGAEMLSILSGKAPLPPVSGKLRRSSPIKHDIKKHSIPPQPISRDEDKRILKPVQDLVKVHKEEKKVNIEPSLDSNDVTMSEIERCYQIGRVVGDGNFAVVRECHRRDNGQMLAIKIVERSKLIGREHMMQNELSLLGSLSHPRIVRLLAHHHTHTHSYLVMELVRGGDLFEAISERGKFSEAAAGMMVSDVSEALDYIHCRSIVHRDLKPENLLIEQVSFDICRLKLGDFGLAMVVSEPVFTICGTPTYVAPEILCEIGYGIAVDVWALGVILYILLCGFPPFRSRARDQEELFKLIKQAQFHFPSQDWDSITEEAKSLVRALLQPDPTVRLTAKQTLQHPWVRAMTASCRQGALIDRNPWNSTDTGDQREELGKTTETQPAEIFVEKSSGHMLGGRNAVIPNKPSKHKERLSKTPGETGPENKPTQLPVKETNRRIPPQCTSLDSTPCQHKHNYTKRH